MLLRSAWICETDGRGCVDLGSSVQIFDCLGGDFSSLPSDPLVTL
jgi:hypothetical protein